MVTGISTYNTPKEREYFSLSSIRCNFENTYKSEKQYDKNSFFHCYFSNVHISVNNEFGNVKLGTHVAKISSFGPSFYFM